MVSKHPKQYGLRPLESFNFTLHGDSALTTRAMIKNLSKIILYVHDMESQVSFYRDILKLPITYPDDTANYKKISRVIFEAGPCQLALHSGGKKRMGRDSPTFTFEVDNIRTSRELLSLKGVSVGEIHSPSPGVEVLDAEDPEGNPFSLEAYQG